MATTHYKMKNLMTILAAILFTSVTLTSYGASKQTVLKGDVSSFYMVNEISNAFGQGNTDNDKVKSVTNTSTNSEITESNSSMSVDCDKFIQDYTAFVNSYIKVLKKYKANPTDASILGEYTKMAQKASKLQANASSCNDAKYAAKLLELSNKMAKALM